MEKEDSTMNKLLINMLEKTMESNIDGALSRQTAKASLSALLSIDQTLKQQEKSMKNMEEAFQNVNIPVTIKFPENIGQGGGINNQGGGKNTEASSDKALSGLIGILKKLFESMKSFETSPASDDKVARQTMSKANSPSGVKQHMNILKEADENLQKPNPLRMTRPTSKTQKTSLDKGKTAAKVIGVQIKLEKIGHFMKVTKQMASGIQKKLPKAFEKARKKILSKVKSLKAHLQKNKMIFQVKSKVEANIKGALKTVESLKTRLSKNPMVLKARVKADAIKSAFSQSASVLTGLFKVPGLAGILSKAGGVAVNYISAKLKKGFSEAWKDNGKAKKMQGELDKVKSAFLRIDSVFQSVITSLFNTVFSAGGDSGSALLGNVVGIFENIAGFLEEKEPIISGIVTTLVTGIMNGFTFLQGFLQPVFTFIGTLFDSFGVGLAGMQAKVAEMMPSIKENLAIVMDWLGPKIGLIADVFSFFINKWIESWPKIQAVLGEVWEKIKPVLKALGKVIDDIFLVYEKVFEFVKENWPIFENIMATVGDVVIKMFESMCNVLADVFNFLGWIIEKFQKLLGIEGGGDSPSRRAMETSMKNDLGNGVRGNSISKKSTGIQYVPYDNFPALLHEGERVLTANENDQFKRNDGKSLVINIPKLADNINASSPVDVDQFIGQLEERIVGLAMNMG
ncbi:hypothetical protein [Fusibacter sp. JL216-2]|uniref:hypothetical protein n=1 Tax=Fusibacter sp. JL216-2 TaxID=3071453 RepID=UPI003D350683